MILDRKTLEKAHEAFVAAYSEACISEEISLEGAEMAGLEAAIGACQADIEPLILGLEKVAEVWHGRLPAGKAISIIRQQFGSGAVHPAVVERGTVIIAASTSKLGPIEPGLPFVVPESAPACYAGDAADRKTGAQTGTTDHSFGQSGKQSPAPTPGQISEAVERMAQEIIECEKIAYPMLQFKAEGYAKAALQALIALGWGPRESASSGEEDVC